MDYVLLDSEFFDSYDGWEANNDKSVIEAYDDWADSDDYE